MTIINDDNIYAVNTLVAAKENPTLPLIIVQYLSRMYYCAIVDHPERKHLVYFERELIPSVTIA